LNDTVVEQLDEDRFARTAIFKLVARKKQIDMPVGGITIRTEHEAGAYAEFKLNYGSPHLGIINAQLVNASETTLPFTNQNLRFFTEYPEGALTPVLNNSVIMVDSCTEYPRYDLDEKLKKIEDSQLIPSLQRKHVTQVRQLKDMLWERDREEYNARKLDMVDTYWNRIDSSASLRAQYIEEALANERLSGGDYGLPPVPVLSDGWSLEIAERMNDLSRRLWSGRFPCATYFVCDPRILEDAHLVDSLISYLRSIAPTNGDSDVVVFKFKEFNITHAESKASQRTGYGELLGRIRQLKKEYNRRLFVLLDAGLQAYPSIVAGFDAVVTSFTGHVDDSRFSTTKENRGWGSYYDRKRMIHVKFSRDLELSKLCACPVCEPVTNLRAITKDFWNFAVCRPHYAMILNSYPSEVKRLVAERNIQEARSPLEASDISNLKSLIPELGSDGTN
jgi:hypothetical protein